MTRTGKAGVAIATAAIVLTGATTANAMKFTLRGNTLYASGPIEDGDAANFARLPNFDTLELDSPGALVG